MLHRYVSRREREGKRKNEYEKKKTEKYRRTPNLVEDGDDAVESV